jgi:hypothetical protein
MTTENASRDRNTTKLELKTRLVTEIDFAALDSPLFTSSTKLNFVPFFLNSWMFLAITCTVSKIKACDTHIMVNMIARSFSLCKVECIIHGQSKGSEAHEA